MKIPRSHTLPGGFKILIRHVSAAKLEELNGDGGCPDSLWIWDEPNGGTIYLERGKDPFVKVRDFIHEMSHAHNEWRTFFERKAGGLG